MELESQVNACVPTFAPPFLGSSLCRAESEAPHCSICRAPLAWGPALGKLGPGNGQSGRHQVKKGQMDTPRGLTLGHGVSETAPTQVG